MYRHQWAMSHCREKAEHLLLNTQKHSTLTRARWLVGGGWLPSALLVR
jgi:hypothetical protein